MTRQRLPGSPIVPGLYDDAGTLHFDAVEYLEGQGIPVNAHNVALLERTFVEAFATRFPGVPISEVEDKP